jgi:hypothetical protein
MKIGIERVIHGVSMAQKIRLGPDQFPEIHACLPPICQVLGIEAEGKGGVTDIDLLRDEGALRTRT